MARRNEEFGLEMSGVAEAERREVALRFLRLVKLERFSDTYPRELSGRMQQCVVAPPAHGCHYQ